MSYSSSDDLAVFIANGASGTALDNDSTPTIQTSIPMEVDWMKSEETPDKDRRQSGTRSTVLLKLATHQERQSVFNHNQSIVPYEIPNHTSGTICKSTRGRHDSVVGDDSDNALPIKAIDDDQASAPTAAIVQSFTMETSPSIYGFRTHKMLRTLRSVDGSSDASGSPNDDERILQEDRLYDWTSHYLGLGIRLSRRKPYGGIFPALHTFPVVEVFDMEWDNLFEDGSVLDVQRAIATGKLHPHVQDQFGQNLLHVRQDSSC